MTTFIFLFFMKIIFATEEPVIFYEHDQGLLTTNIHIVLLSGSINDPIGKAGTTNIMAELILRGTKNKSRSAFQIAVEKLGGTIGSSTSHDMLLFSGEVIAENTIAFLDLIEEALFSPGFQKKEFLDLKKEITSGLLYLKNDNMSLAELAITREIFKSTPLEFPVTGTISSLKKIDLKTVLDVYNKIFIRENFIFAISSPLSEKTIADKITKFWLKYPRGKKIETPKVTLNIPTKPKLILINKKVPATGSVFMAQRGIAIQDKLRYTLILGNHAFGGRALTSRLFKIIRSELGWTYSIGSSYESVNELSSQEGVYAIYAFPSVEYSFSVIEKSFKLWNDFFEKGLTSDELKRSKEALINSYPFLFDTAGKRLKNKIISYIYKVPILSPHEYETVINNINNNDIVSALKNRHSLNNWVISIVADKDVFKKQLEEAQSNLNIDVILEPEHLIE